jgi:hypothetical protein
MDAPELNEAVKFKFVPSQTGEADTTGVAGIGLITTEVVVERTGTLSLLVTVTV